MGSMLLVKIFRVNLEFIQHLVLSFFAGGNAYLFNQYRHGFITRKPPLWIQFKSSMQAI